MAWEEDDEFWDGLSLDWALDGAFEEEALAIRDVMEEEFLRGNVSTPKVKRQEGAFASAKLH